MLNFLRSLLTKKQIELLNGKNKSLLPLLNEICFYSVLIDDPSRQYNLFESGDFQFIFKKLIEYFISPEKDDLLSEIEAFIRSRPFSVPLEERIDFPNESYQIETTDAVLSLDSVLRFYQTFNANAIQSLRARPKQHFYIQYYAAQEVFSSYEIDISMDFMDSFVDYEEQPNHSIKLKKMQTITAFSSSSSSSPTYSVPFVMDVTLFFKTISRLIDHFEKKLAGELWLYFLNIVLYDIFKSTTNDNQVFNHTVLYFPQLYYILEHWHDFIPFERTNEMHDDETEDLKKSLGFFDAVVEPEKINNIYFPFFVPGLQKLDARDVPPMIPIEFYIHTIAHYLKLRKSPQADALMIVSSYLGNYPSGRGLYSLFEYYYLHFYNNEKTRGWLDVCMCLVELEMTRRRMAVTEHVQYYRIFYLHILGVIETILLALSQMYNYLVMGKPKMLRHTGTYKANMMDAASFHPRVMDYWRGMMNDLNSISMIRDRCDYLGYQALEHLHFFDLFHYFKPLSYLNLSISHYEQLLGEITRIRQPALFFYFELPFDRPQTEQIPPSSPLVPLLANDTSIDANLIEEYYYIPLTEYPDASYFMRYEQLKDGLNPIQDGRSVFVDFSSNTQNLRQQIVEDFLHPLVYFLSSFYQKPHKQTIGREFDCTDICLSLQERKAAKRIYFDAVPESRFLIDDHGALAPDLMNLMEIDQSQPLKVCVKLCLEDVFLYFDEFTSEVSLIDATKLSFKGWKKVTHLTDESILTIMLVFGVRQNVKYIAKNLSPGLEYSRTIVNPKNPHRLIHLVTYQKNHDHFQLTYHYGSDQWVFREDVPLLAGGLVPNTSDLPVAISDTDPQQRYFTFWMHTRNTPINVQLEKTEIDLSTFMMVEQVFGWPSPLPGHQFAFSERIALLYYRSNGLGEEEFLIKKDSESDLLASAFGIPLYDADEDAMDERYQSSLDFLQDLFAKPSCQNKVVLFIRKLLDRCGLQNNPSFQKQVLEQFSESPAYLLIFKLYAFITQFLKSSFPSSPLFGTFPTTKVAMPVIPSKKRARPGEGIQYESTIQTNPLVRLQAYRSIWYRYSKTKSVAMRDEALANIPPVISKVFYQALYLYTMDPSPVFFQRLFEGESFTTFPNWDPVQQRKDWLLIEKRLALSPSLLLEMEIRASDGKFYLLPQFSPFSAAAPEASVPIDQWLEVKEKRLAIPLFYFSTPEDHVSNTHLNLECLTQLQMPSFPDLILPFQRFENDVQVLLQTVTNQILEQTPWMPGWNLSRRSHLSMYPLIKAHRESLIASVMGKYVLDHGCCYEELKLIVITMTPLFHWLFFYIIPFHMQEEVVFRKSDALLSIWNDLLSRGYNLIFVPTFFVNEDQTLFHALSETDVHVDAFLKDYLSQYFDNGEMKGRFSSSLSSPSVSQIYFPLFHFNAKLVSFFVGQITKFQLFPTQLLQTSTHDVNQIRNYFDQLLLKRVPQLDHFKLPPVPLFPFSSQSSSSSSSFSIIRYWKKN